MKKKILSILLALLLLSGGTFGFSLRAGALYYSEGQKIARVITDEGLVLLKNENAALPIRPGSSVALFGEAQKLVPNTFQDVWNIRGYIPYGYGSESQVGDFGGKAIDPLDALIAAESNGEISLYHPSSDNYTAALETGAEYVPTDEEVAAAAAAVLLFVLLRRKKKS